MYTPLMRKYIQVLFTVCIIFFIGACMQQQTTPPRNFSLVDLLITSNDMPMQWQIEFPAGKFRNSYYAKESVKIVFVPETGVRRPTGHSIYQFTDSDEAQFKFHNEFTPNVLDSGEFVPKEWVYPVLFADEDKFVCFWTTIDGDPDKYMLCEWTARYDEFIVYFNSWGLPELMSLEQINRLIVKIDQMMVEYLSAE